MKFFKLPEDCIPMSMMAIGCGYQADIDALDDDFKATELAERNRTRLNQHFYFGEWGGGL